LWFENAEDDEWGVKIEVGAGIEDGITLNAAWGWINFSDGLVKLSAGKIDDGVWGTTGYQGHDYSNDGLIRLEIKPSDELDLGLAFAYPNGGYEAGKIGNFFQQTIIGAKYSAEDSFTVATALKLFSEEDDYTDGDGMDVGWYLGFGYFGIEDLGINLEVLIDHLAKMSDKGEEAVTLQIDYSGVENLGIGVAVGFGFVKSFELDSFFADVWADYTVNDNVTVGADVTLNANGDFAFTSYDFSAYAKYAVGNAWMKGVIGANITTADSDDGEGTNPFFKLVFGFDF